MKKLSVFLALLIMFVSTTMLSSEEKKGIGIFGNFGYSAFDLEGFSFDVGAEIPIIKHLYGQFLFDYYAVPGDFDNENLQDSAYSIGFYTVFKHPTSKKMSFSLKFGGNYTKIKSWNYIEEEDEFVPINKSDFGISGGIGIEFSITERVGWLFGGTFHTLFSEKKIYWLKLYSGFCIYLK